MNNAKIRIFTRVAKSRMSRGESLDDILAGWEAKLTPEEIEAIRKAVLA